jgi:two-component system, OmpR family, phosphate regulon response regulator PhoB
MVPSHDERPCVLMIEDDRAIREVFAWALDDEGYAVVALADCRRARAYLHANRPPDLILLDYHLPRMNGVEFVRTIQRNPRLRDVPILMMSASLEAERATRQIGVAGFLPKPFETDRLINMVRRLIARAQAPRRVRIYAAAV